MMLGELIYKICENCQLLSQTAAKDSKISNYADMLAHVSTEETVQGSSMIENPVVIMDYILLDNKWPNHE